MPLHNFSPDRPVLLVPDVHQDLRFLENAIALAQKEAAALCFLGDFVDGLNARWHTAAALKAIASQLAEVAQTHPHGCVILAGNHDVSALTLARLRARLLLEGNTSKLTQLDSTLPAATAYTELLRLWPTSFLKTWQIATIAHGFLLSHAGVSRRYWPWSAAPDTERQTTIFLKASEDSWQNWLRDGTEDLFFAVGPARGGRNAPVGGPLWLDWDAEFVDDLPLPQAVGHTRAKDVRHKDRSWCLDATQTHVGLLHPDFGLRAVRV